MASRYLPWIKPDPIHWAEIKLEEAVRLLSQYPTLPETVYLGLLDRSRGLMRDRG